MLCDDIIECIGIEYKKIKQKEKYYKLYGDIIKHLKYYLHTYINEKNHLLSLKILQSGDLRIDSRFLYDNNFINKKNNHYYILSNIYGKQAIAFTLTY